MCVFVHIRITYTPTLAHARTPYHFTICLIYMAFSVWFFSLEYFICNYYNDLLLKCLLLLGFATDIASLVMVWSQNSIPLWMWSQNIPLAVHVHTYFVITNINTHSAMQQNESAWCSICYALAALPGIVAIMSHTQ